MSEVTAPIMTDATGQSIDSKLNSLLTKMDNLAAAFQPNASGIVYSNTTSGLTGDDVQEAIDEMAADVTEIKSSLSDLNTISDTNLEVSDSKNFCSTIYTRKVFKCGNLKIANIIVVINQNTTATGNTWTKVFTLPTGYESLLSASTVACEVPLTVTTKAISSIAIVQARIYNKNEIQFVLREPATGNYTYYAQMVYV